MTIAPADRHRPSLRRLLLFLLGALVWSFLSCYPNPTVFSRNLSRYRHPPIDPNLEQRMQWDLPAQPATIELFVDSLLVATPDWRLYRVPWYVPTPAEAVVVLHGDCEAKAFVFASLLEGKGLAYEMRASFNHIWIDYPGREPRPGESQELAYLQGTPDRLRLRWPSQVPWRDFLSAQQAQLWQAMPLARKALWLTGILWLGLAVLLLRGRLPEGQLLSQWRAPTSHYLLRAAWTSVLLLGLIVVASALRPSSLPVRWTLPDVREVFILCAVAGGFIAWLTLLHWRTATTVRDDASGVTVFSSLGPWQRQEHIATPVISHLELEASPGGLRPWIVAAALRTGERLPLLRHRDELSARSHLRTLGLALNLPLLVSCFGAESRTSPEEIHRSLQQRAARRPAPEPLPRPRSCDLEIEEAEGRWSLHYPLADRKIGCTLLGCGSLPALLALLSTGVVLRYPRVILLWFWWIVAISALGLTIYFAFVFGAELISRLTGARVEIADGKFRFHRPDRKVEEIDLEHIESVELARIGETPTIAIVSPDRVIHLRGLCLREHRSWVRQIIEEAIVKAACQPQPSPRP